MQLAIRILKQYMIKKKFLQVEHLYSHLFKTRNLITLILRNRTKSFF